ncbi:MAG: signal recognition particle-docking protein FtsY [Candidatus Pacebacteria bacterium]|nr:signal recognition particle-docking protein FtsY [Candidatus Paceibacterota bacterium]
MTSVFTIFKHGLQRTKTTLVRRIRGAFGDRTTWDEESFEDLEAALLSADLGVDISMRLVDDIRDRYERGEISTAEDILEIAHEDLTRVLVENGICEPKFQSDGTTVIMIVGVNGSGKTTTAGKLAHQWRSDGKSVMLAACDTFRAAAIEQLKIWGDKVGCPVIAGQRGGDAAAVAYDAASAAGSRGMDVLIVDTAGRQHTRKELMDELAKVRRTLNKACPGAPHEVWLTVDASTGTNALMQAREFGRVCDLTGLILTKLDGSGKGGVVVPICKELGYPVYFVGLGEQTDDLQPFDPDLFARALFE